MQEEYSIEVDNIKKSFRVYHDKGFTLKEASLFKNRRSYEIRNVIDGLSFKVKKGEAVALVGHNGCGKSTTLKMLTRIFYPDSGNITMRGRVSSLLELGAGFHADMTGRENIFINAAIFGLTHKEIEARLDDIIAFSELEEFIDNPVRTYSSGMYMRLAFAVAINVDADILLIDEILVVGDAAFQVKCFNRLREILGKGTTIVLVSHSTRQIEQLCDRCIWIHDGKVRADGKPSDINPLYLDFIAKRGEDKKKEPEKEEPKVFEVTRYGSGEAQISGVKLFRSGEPAIRFDAEDPCTIKVDYTVKEEVKDTVFGIKIYRNDGVLCYGTTTRAEHLDRITLTKDGSVEFIMPRLSLISGEYSVDLSIETGEEYPVDYWKGAAKFNVTSNIEDEGTSRIAHEWKQN
ncbi:ABC transporter ATP-binding protein [Butyrivibrio sp. INlla16]|uniref:ABC transporter ATP-binding protein n=1 Tax=Butyrivibrio sp. INlla16 TaxID=1520807 RepID=UPI000891F1E7|nr:ABC transporter ATP-binding protein [Butyrivibrio sp. INlla16]SDB18944.1 ABC-2 type transport system ATP-binding protein [Butyrivibrio sp. INlla16]